jgi:hypothetical protein
LILEESADEGSISFELVQVGRWLEDNYSPFITDENLGATKVVVAPAKAVDARWNNVSARWEVGIGVTWVVLRRR